MSAALRKRERDAFAGAKHGRRAARSDQDPFVPCGAGTAGVGAPRIRRGELQRRRGLTGRRRSPAVEDGRDRRPSWGLRRRDRHDDRPVPSGRHTRGRRHGGRLPRDGHEAEPARGDQVSIRKLARRGGPAPLPARSADGVVAESPAHRHRVRRGRDRRPPVSGHRIRRRRHAAPLDRDARAAQAGGRSWSC